MMRNDQIFLRIKVRSLEIYQHYLGHLYPFGMVAPGKKISNPFLSYKQETPSFNIYKGQDGTFLFNDFATGDKGNPITFVQKMERVELNEALQIIKNQIL